MFKAAYDTNDNDVVDNASKLAGSTKGEVQNHTPKTHNHTESQISDLDHDALKIKGVIINDAAKADQKVLAYDSGSQRIIYISQAPSGAIIKSIQTGIITVAGDHTINEVDPDKTMIVLGGVSTDDINPGTPQVFVELTASTTLSVTAWIGVPTVAFAVIEFEAGVSVQRGYTVLTDVQYIDVTINEVDPDRTILNSLGGGESNRGAWFTPWAYLLNSTTVRLDRQTSSVTGTISWEAVEFL